MRRTLAIALACMALTPMAFAQGAASPAKMQLAAKMYDATGAAGVFTNMEYSVISGTMGEIGQGIADKASCPALQQSAVQPQVQSFKAKLDPVFTGMADAQFRQEATKIFADAFTEDEMRTIIAFLQSPTGQKFTHANGELNQRISNLAVARAKTHSAEISGAQKDFAATIQKIAASCPATPASATPPKG
jgi:hypothetical protein